MQDKGKSVCLRCRCDGVHVILVEHELDEFGGAEEGGGGKEEV